MGFVMPEYTCHWIPVDCIRADDDQRIDPILLGAYRGRTVCGENPPAIIVYPGKRGWMLRDGRHRLAVAKMIGRKLILAAVVNDREQAEELSRGVRLIGPIYETLC